MKCGLCDEKLETGQGRGILDLLLVKENRIINEAFCKNCFLKVQRDETEQYRLVYNEDNAQLILINNIRKLTEAIEKLNEHNLYERKT